MKRLRNAAASSLCIAVVLCAASFAQPNTGLITKVSGEATTTSGGTLRPAQLADLLAEGAVLRTGKTGRVAFVFCPALYSAELGPESEAVITANALDVRRGKLENRKTIPFCRLPVTADARSKREHISAAVLRGNDTLVLCSPTGGAVLPNEVTFRWKPLEGAEKYRVELRTMNSESIWNVEAQGEALSYTGSLVPGTAYRWRVTAFRADEVLSSVGSSFRTLDVPSATQLRDTQKQYKAWIDENPSDPTPHLLLGLAYEELKLQDDALAEYKAARELLGKSSWLDEKIAQLLKG